MSPITTKTKLLTAGGLTVLLTLGLAACGSDDGADVRGSASASASGSGSGSAAGSASGSVSADAGHDAAECSPVGEDLADDAVETREIRLEDYGFDPAIPTVPAGIVTFHGINSGHENHEIAFLPGGGDVPLTADGEPDEDALAEAGAFELEAFGPGQTCDATFELEAGTYTMFCLVEAHDGETHLSKGMVGLLTVE